MKENNKIINGGNKVSELTLVVMEVMKKVLKLFNMEVFVGTLLVVNLTTNGEDVTNVSMDII